MFLSLGGVSVIAANTPSQTLTLSGSTIQLLLAASIWYEDPANWRADNSGTPLDDIEIDIVLALVDTALAELTP